MKFKTTIRKRDISKEGLRLNQIDLVIAIMNEVSRQAKAQGVSDEICHRHMNIICNSATNIVKDLEKPFVPAAEGMGLANWLASDDTGMSSKAMAGAIHGVHVDFSERTRHPLDSEDFGRCYRFLRAVPCGDWTYAVSNLSPQWKALAENWTELEALYEKQDFKALNERLDELLK